MLNLSHPSNKTISSLEQNRDKSIKKSLEFPLHFRARIKLSSQFQYTIALLYNVAHNFKLFRAHS